MSEAAPQDTPPPPRRGPLGRLLRLLGRALLASVALLLALGAALYGALGTTAGSDWLLRTGASAGGVTLDYAALRGTLLGRLELDALDVAAGETQVRVRRAVLDWQPVALLSSRLLVEELIADGVQVETPPAPPSEEPLHIAVPELPALTLPLAVRIARLAISDLRLGGADTEPVLTRLALRVDAEGDRVRISEIELAHEELTLAGGIAAALREDWPLEGGIAVSGSQGELAVALTLELSGSARAPVLAIALEAPAAARADLRAELREHPPRVALDLRWEEIALPAIAPVTSSGGSLRASNEGLDLSVALQARLAGAPGDVRELELRANGRLATLEAPLAGALDLDWRVLTAAATFAGNGRVAGDAARLEIEHALAQPFEVTTRGQVHPDGVATRVELAGDWRGLAWPPGAADGPGSPSGRYTLAGRLSDLSAHLEAALERAGGVEQLTLDLSGGAAPAPPHAFQARLAWQAKTQPAGDLSGEGQAEGDAGAVRFSHRLAGPGTASVAIEGNATLSGAPSLDLEGRWNDLRWPLEGVPTALSPSGRVTLRGPPDALAVSVDAQAEADPVGPLALRASATVTPTEAKQLDLSVDLLEGTATARGRVGWAAGVTAVLALEARGIDPARFDARAAGALDALLDLDVAISEGRPVGTLALQRLGGSLGGYPVNGSGRVRLTVAGVDVSALVLETGDNRLEVNGAMEDELALDYRLRAPALEQLWPELAGSVDGEGSLRGRPEAPVVRARLAARALRAGELRLGTATLEANVDLAADSDSTVTLSAAGLQAAGQVIDTVELSLSGRRAEHRLSASAVATDGRLALAARGGLAEGGRWSGSVDTLDLLQTPLGDWRLESPTRLEAGADGAESGEACLASEGARLCARAARAGEGAQQIDATLAGLTLARFGPWLPEGLEVEGAVDAKLGARTGEALTASASITATPTRLTLPDATEQGPITLLLEGTAIDARHGPEGTELSVRSRIGGDGRVQGELRLGAGGDAPPALAGRVQAGLPDLAPFNALVPALSGLAGRLNADLTLAGSVAEPRVSGTLALADGGASVPAVGITLERAAIEVAGGDDGRFTLRGEVHSGPGMLTLEGSGHVGADGWAVALKTRGENFEAAKLVSLQARLSPEIDVDASPQRIAVRGKVHVPAAQVTVKELPQGVVEVSDDETLVGRESPQPPAWRRNLDVAVDVTLGDEVRVSAFGLDTGLAGGLGIRVEGAAAPSGRGAVRLEGGRFTAYGQDLKIRRGRLLFAGPLDNPGLDFEAVRETSEVTAGIAISGSAENIRSRVFSEPPLPEAEALAWLLTGRGLSGASAGTGATLANAALALGLDQGEQVTREIGTALGLDQFSVAPGESLEQTALVLGKQLTPKLFIRYTMAVIENEGQVELVYKLTDNVSLEAQSGTASQGADVIYQLER